MTAALIDDPLDPLGAPSSAPDSAPDPGCPGFGYGCVKPAGHKGQHKKDPAAKARNRRGKSPAGSGGGLSAAPTRPGRSKSGSMLAPLLAMAYGGAGMKVEQAGYDTEGNPGPLAAAGRVMQFQAPLAGVQLDKALARVPVYSRVAKLTGSTLLDDLAPLLLGPLLAVAMASSDTAQATLAPMFAAVMQSAAVEVVKIQKEQNKAMAAVGEQQAEADALAMEMMTNIFGPPAEPGDYDPAAGQ